MDGLLFLWLMWAGWIISTFLISKNNPWRFKVSVCSLLLIISFPFGFRFSGFQPGAAVILIFLFSLLMIKEFSLAEKLYLFISAFIIAASYSSFMLLTLYDPIMLIADEKVMITVILLVLSYLLYSKWQTFRKRMLAVTVGLINRGILDRICFHPERITLSNRWTLVS